MADAVTFPSDWREPLRWLRRAAWRVGTWRARWPKPIGTRPPHYLVACAIFRDEAPYLAEWVTFHRLQGVERFWLYDNLSRDDWRSALAPEIRAGIVEVTPWSLEPGQLPAYADCLRRHRDDARWIAFLDIDEFLFSPTGRELPEILGDFERYPAVSVNWRTYGTSGHVERPPGLVTESYPWRVRDEIPINEHVKSIVYPRRTSPWVQNPHMFRLYGHAVGETCMPVTTAFRTPATAELLRINHYWSRSVADLRRKRDRPSSDTGQVARPDPMRMLGDAVDEREGLPIPRDEVYDDVAVRIAPQLRAVLARRA